MDLQNFWLWAPTTRNLGSKPGNPGVVKKLTMSQEGSRRLHGAAGLLDGQCPQLDDERGIHLVPL